MTPAMERYFELKKEYPDSILFFRMGDFYEMFDSDARLVAEELDLTLTSRQKNEQKKPDVENNPMCGVPFHAADVYIGRLTAKGYKVAICEQMAMPGEVTGVLPRDVVRVITPGTITDTNQLEEKSNNFLCAAYCDGGVYGAAFADISTGELFLVTLPSWRKLLDELARYSPAEMIFSAMVYENEQLRDEIALRFHTRLDKAKQEPTWEHSKELILMQFGAESLAELSLSEDSYVVNTLGLLLDYLAETQKTFLTHIRQVRHYAAEDYMEIDANSRRNLELTSSMRLGGKKGSLLWILDKTKTAMGGRMLKSFLEKPLTSCTKIQKRLFAVETLVKQPEWRQDLLSALGEIQDLERLIGRIVCKTATPRELIALKRSLLVLPEVELLLARMDSPLITELCGQLDTLGDILDLLEESIRDDAPNMLREGGIIKDGFDAAVDTDRDLQQNGHNAVTRMEEAERERTGVKTLKIGYNRVFGYYIDVPKSFTGEVPEGYIRKQTLANNERYINADLKALEDKLLGAEERLRQREYKLFCDIRDRVAQEVERVQQTATAVALVDVLCSFAEVAVKNNYTMPTVDISDTIQITDGRHPVVEKVLRDELFVPNDAHLNCTDERFLIITGPNMAGKSTYMRQVALIVIMAQIGSFVPAAAATIGICDKIFTRIGASDDLSAGQSTFMVEMTELSNILQNATSKSLLLLDEIGRGTSTFDGLSIAWSACEYIASRKKLGAKTLFATHYHEMTALEGQLDGVKNYSIACKKRGDSVTFLRRIVRGGADDSYGIEVAALAGLPKQVISRAKEILAEIEDREGRKDAVIPQKVQEAEPQLGFGDIRAAEIMDRLATIDVSTLTPIEAMNVLYELQKQAQN
ncbi:MAG: DNA mismatch repair protein MutS [Ruminococcaceae bacterium]|nr:DNA mismatch repair protein MutS [Oscillospiraceae bacterium]